MAPVRRAAIGPMLVGRELEEISWEPVQMENPRTAHRLAEAVPNFA